MSTLPAPGADGWHDLLLRCSRCATCLPVCPSYAATVRELASPRGRLQLLRAHNEGRLAQSDGLYQALYSCLDCRACATACPNGLSPGEMALQARAQMPDGVTPMQRALRRLILGPGLSQPIWLDIGTQAARLAYQRVGVQRLLRSSGLLAHLPLLERLDRMLPPLPARSVRRSLPEVNPANGTERGRIGLFLGCAMNTLFADVTRSTVRVLNRLGYTVVIDRRVVCCGAPQHQAGEQEIAHRMAEHNVQMFEGLETVITDCAACGAELKSYGRQLGTEAARQFSARVRDLSEFLAPLDLPPPVEVGLAVWHAPCHLAHAQGVCAQPRELVRRLCTRSAELAEHDRCCGSAGSYWLTHPHVAEDALARKRERIRQSGAETVVTANPGCLLQLMAGCEPQDRWQVMHLSTLAERALEGRP